MLDSWRRDGTRHSSSPSGPLEFVAIATRGHAAARDRLAADSLCHCRLENRPPPTRGGDRGFLPPPLMASILQETVYRMGRTCRFPCAPAFDSAPPKRLRKFCRQSRSRSRQLKGSKTPAALIAHVPTRSSKSPGGTGLRSAQWGSTGRCAISGVRDGRMGPWAPSEPRTSGPDPKTGPTHRRHGS